MVPTPGTCLEAVPLAGGLVASMRSATSNSWSELRLRRRERT